MDLSGPAGAPLIVFLHGSRLTRASWRAITSRLDAEFRCLALDLPAHGGRADRPFTLAGAVADVEAAIDAVGGDRVIVVGHSLGGYVAMALAADRPEQVRGLVLAGASADPTGPTWAGFRLFAWALGALPEGPFDAINSRYLRRRYPPEIAEPIIAGGYWTRGAAEAVRVIAGESFRDRLLAYGGPTLVVNGDLDLVFRLGEGPFTRGIPNVRRRVLGRTTHLVPLDRPDRFAAEVRAFARSLPA